METILNTAGLTKHYGGTAAVDDLSITVRRGEIYGFLGRNGAGKTTTIRMLLGLIRPDGGRIELFGERFSAKEHLPRIGSMVENPGFYPNLTGRENLEIWRILSGTRIKDAVKRALETACLTDEADKRVGRYSMGMKQRLGLARAVLHNPELLILDEPTNGLDPAGIQQVRKFLIHLSRESGITVFLSSHLLSEVQQTADRVGIIHEGKLREEVSLSELGERNRKYIDLTVDKEPETAFVLERTLGLKDFIADGAGRFRLYSHLDRPHEVNRALVERGIGVSHLTVRQDDLEQYFLTLTEETDA